MQPKFSAPERVRQRDPRTPRQTDIVEPAATVDAADALMVDPP